MGITSTNENEVDVLFCIHSQRGIEIDLYSCQPHQEDILFLPGTYLEVMSFLKYNDNLYFITLKELTPVNQMFPDFQELDYKTETQQKNENREIERLKAENERLKADTNDKDREIERLKADTNDKDRENQTLKYFNQDLYREVKILEKKKNRIERRRSSQDDIVLRDAGEKKKLNKKKQIISVQGDNGKSEASEISEEKTDENLSHRGGKKGNKKKKIINRSSIDLNSAPCETLSNNGIICKNKKHVISAISREGNFQIEMQRLNLWGSSIGDIGTSKLFHAIIREKK